MSATGKQWLMSFVEWAVKALIVAAVTLLWNMFQMQNEFLRKMEKTDARIAQLENEVAMIKGNMVTQETLKRVELYMELVMRRHGNEGQVDLTGNQK